MARVNITIDLPDEIEQEARDAGLFNLDLFSSVIEIELKRQLRRFEAGRRLTEMMDVLSEDFRAEYGHLSEEDAMAMLARWGDENTQASTNDETQA